MSAQLAIDWNPVRQARGRDPQTSHDAAAKAGGLASEHRGMILKALADGQERTAEDIADLAGLTSVQVNRRVHELSSAKSIEFTGGTRNNRAGRPMRLMRLVGGA